MPDSKKRFTPWSRGWWIRDLLQYLGMFMLMVGVISLGNWYSDTSVLETQKWIFWTFFVFAWCLLFIWAKTVDIQKKITDDLGTLKVDTLEVGQIEAHKITILSREGNPKIRLAADSEWNPGPDSPFSHMAHSGPARDGFPTLEMYRESVHVGAAELRFGLTEKGAYLGMDSLEQSVWKSVGMGILERPYIRLADAPAHLMMEGTEGQIRVLISSQKTEDSASDSTTELVIESRNGDFQVSIHKGTGDEQETIFSYSTGKGQG